MWRFGPGVTVPMAAGSRLISIGRAPSAADTSCIRRQLLLAFDGGPDLRLDRLEVLRLDHPARGVGLEAAPGGLAEEPLRPDRILLQERVVGVEDGEADGVGLGRVLEAAPQTG